MMSIVAIAVARTNPRTLPWPTDDAPFLAASDALEREAVGEEARTAFQLNAAIIGQLVNAAR